MRLLLRRIIILAVAALIVVMMAAVPAVAQSEDEFEKCEDAKQELAKANSEKEIEKATRKVAEKCPAAPPPP